MTIEVVSSKRGAVPDAVNEVGALVTFSAQTVLTGARAIALRRFPLAETLNQAQFLFRVCTIPALLLMIPIGVLTAVIVGGLATQIGAAGYSGAVVAFVIIGQAAALVTALMMAGVGGSAICADMGSRTIREEVQALHVMSVDVIERVVVPRVFAAIFVAICMVGMVTFAGVFITFVNQVLVVGESPGAFLMTLTSYGRVSDFTMAIIKATCFAIVSALICAFKGLHAKGGPAGVANAVNEAVVLAFIAVFVVNVVLSQLYITLVPAVGEYM